MITIKILYIPILKHQSSKLRSRILVLSLNFFGLSSSVSSSVLKSSAFEPKYPTDLILNSFQTALNTSGVAGSYIYQKFIHEIYLNTSI
jgi:hypothetical protein